MLIKDNVELFDNSGWLFEFKWDGERCVTYLDPKTGTELQNKRQVRMNPKVPEFAEIYKQVRKKCILDGEYLTRPPTERKKLQQRMVKENEQIAVSRYIEANGNAFYALAEKLVGVVGKRKDSIYIPDKRCGAKNMIYCPCCPTIVQGFVALDKSTLPRYSKIVIRSDIDTSLEESV